MDRGYYSGEREDMAVRGDTKASKSATGWGLRSGYLNGGGGDEGDCTSGGFGAGNAGCEMELFGAGFWEYETSSLARMIFFYGYK